MLIVNLKGGLGNQMFQYAFAYARAMENEENLKIDTEFFTDNKKQKYVLDSFNFDVDIATKKEVIDLKYNNPNIFTKAFIKRKKWQTANAYYEECDHSFEEQALKISGDIYFDGFWQSERYFIKYRSEILKQFTLKNSIHPKTEQLKQQIQQAKSVSLHIRRGDYLNSKAIEILGICSLDYYKNAVAEILKIADDSHFFIFSDDLFWAKSNLDFIANKTFIDLCGVVPDCEEMYLMSQCQHNIIANSTFSWWGAWLNQNPAKTVIAPKEWFADKTRDTKDLLPDAWLRLNTGHKTAHKDYLLDFIIADMRQVLEQKIDLFIDGKITNLKDIDAIYSVATQNKKSIILRFFRAYIKNNASIKYNFFDKASPILVVYWLRYKIKKYFKKTY